MPIFEYRCRSCRQQFEILVGRGRDENLPRCPACGQGDAIRVFGGVAVGISRTQLNPGTFIRQRGQPPAYAPPRKGQRAAGG